MEACGQFFRAGGFSEAAAVGSVKEAVRGSWKEWAEQGHSPPLYSQCRQEQYWLGGRERRRAHCFQVFAVLAVESVIGGL